MAIGPIDPFQNIVGLDVEAPDEIYVILRIAVTLTELRDFRTITTGGPPQCNPMGGPNVIRKGHGAVRITTYPYFGSSVLNPAVEGFSPAELSEGEALVALSVLEKESVQYASSLEDIDLNTVASDFEAPGGQTIIGSGGGFLGQLVPRQGYSSAQEQCVASPQDEAMRSLAWDSDGKAFFSVLDWEGLTISAPDEFTLTVKLYEGTSLGVYGIDQNAASAGMLPGRGEPAHFAGVGSGDGLFSRDFTFNEFADVEIPFQGEQIRYRGLDKEQDEGDTVLKILEANEAIILDEPAIDGVGGGHVILAPWAVVLRMKKTL